MILYNFINIIDEAPQNNKSALVLKIFCKFLVCKDIQDNIILKKNKKDKAFIYSFTHINKILIIKEISCKDFFD